MKGSGEVINALLLILTMIGILGILLATAYGENLKRSQIILDEAELLRVKNTFYLVNKSIGTTWYISNVQSIFRAGDSNVNCGLDDTPDNVDAGYWYQFKPIENGTGKISSCVDNNGCLNPNGPRIPQAAKYNFQDYKPRICNPSKDNVASVMNEKIQPFLELKKDSEGNVKFQANSVTFTINNIENKVEIEDTKITSNTKQDINAVFGRGDIIRIQGTYENENIIQTNFYKMILDAKKITENALAFSDMMIDDSFTGYVDASPAGSMDYSLWYQDLDSDFDPVPGVPYTQNHMIYEDSIKTKLLETLKQSVPSNLRITFSQFELLVPGSTDVWSSNSQENRGIILHYNAKAKFSDGEDIESQNSCNLNEASNYQSEITAAAEKYMIVETELDQDQEEALIKGLIQQESAWDPDIVSSAGAVGLMQLLPSTAQGECNLQESELTDPAKNIDCGTFVLFKYTSQARSVVESVPNGDVNDVENLIKLGLASYNGGPGRVQCLIQQYGPDWDTIASSASGVFSSECPGLEGRVRLPDETREYVGKVLGHMLCFGGEISITGSGAYYYYDETPQEKFYKRPISLEIKLEDNVPVLDCSPTTGTIPHSEVQQSGQTAFIRYFIWNPTAVSGDLVCCNTQLYSCNANINGMSETNKIITGGTVNCASSTEGGTTLTCNEFGFS